ncbi:MAG: sulfatase [Emcibacter sp.]|nr:sulfatase [Emcibacter sp.]
MVRAQFLSFFFFVTFSVFILSSVSSDAADTEIKTNKKKQPNIVFIFADDLGYGDIGLFGGIGIETPNIDALGQQGIKFTDFYAVSPVCTPSRAALLTGRYPIRYGIHSVFFPRSFTGLPESEITIPEILNKAGYISGIFGKWHLGHREKFLPLQQGFDEFFGTPYSNDMNSYVYIEGNDVVQWTVDQQFLTQTLTHKAVDFIDRHHDQPFFLYIPHPMPHVPLFASPEFQGTSKRGLYGDVVQELDWSVGEIIKALKEKEILNNTLIIFSSDNGPWLTMGNAGGDAVPLRGGKQSTFEGGMRVPTVAMWPDEVNPGQVIQTPLTMMDWLPTFANLAGVSLPDNLVLDGADISSIMQGGGKDGTYLIKDREFAYYYGGKLQAYRLGDWKLKLAQPKHAKNYPAWINWLSLRVLRGQETFQPHELLLFNMRQDKQEKYNLAHNNPEKVKEIQQAIQVFQDSLGEVPEKLNVGNYKFIQDDNRVLFDAIFFVLKWAAGIISICIFAIGWFIARKVYRRKT